MSDDLIIPGFTADQSWAMEVVAERAAQRVMDKLLESDCPLPCRRMETLEAVVFGRAEANVVGLLARMAASEGTLNQLRRVTWTAVAALIVAFTGLLLSFLR